MNSSGKRIFCSLYWPKLPCILLMSLSVPFLIILRVPTITSTSSRPSSCPDCIFKIHQLWQSGFSRVYSNCCCSCSFDTEIIKISQPFHKMYSNNIVNFQESTTVLNAHTKKVWKLIVCTSNVLIELHSYVIIMSFHKA